MPLRPCLGARGEPPCKALVASPANRCPAHQRARDARKNAEPHRAVYRDPRWHRCRRRALHRAEWRCEVVEAGIRCGHFDPTGTTLHGHHNYPGGVKAMLRDGVSPFDERRVVIVCEHHHPQVERLLRGTGRVR